VPAEVPHFDLPFRFAGGAAVVNEQDSPDEIVCCVEAILRYRQGQRTDLPEFGIPDVTFTEGEVDEEELREIVGEWEERADLYVEPEFDPLDEGLERIGFYVSGGEE
jgi:hypothetical protein